jgi:elongation of very long chain fatty acids protein 7
MFNFDPRTIFLRWSWEVNRNIDYVVAPSYASKLTGFVFPPLQMLNLCFIYYLSKLTEFADTVFFVLRKKKNQITWLHLYHHALTPIEAWMLVKFISGLKINSERKIQFSGGNATFPNILNNFVHILMYFYYMLAAMGPQYQKYLWWKRYMTELQMVSESLIQL